MMGGSHSFPATKVRSHLLPVLREKMEKCAGQSVLKKARLFCDGRIFEVWDDGIIPNV